MANRSLPCVAAAECDFRAGVGRVCCRAAWREPENRGTKVARPTSTGDSMKSKPMIPPQRCFLAMMVVLVAVAGLFAVIIRASVSIAFGIGASVGSALLAGQLAFFFLVRPRLRALDRLREALA